jgi:UDP-N-acetylglucosamine 2-epimerase (non-hydrolysing)
MRDETERPEAVEAGTVRLVGTNVEKITNAIAVLLTDESQYQSMAMAHNPYGDGQSCARILESLSMFVNTKKAKAIRSN